jgi:hypothetical protein
MNTTPDTIDHRPERRRARPSRGGRTAAVLVVLAAVVLGASGCASDDGGGAPPPGPSGAKIATSLTALLDQALARTDLSPEVREILERSKATGSIAAADYEAAFGRYAKCVRDAGVSEEYKKLSSGIYQVTPHYSTTSEAAERADFDKSNECGFRHLATVESLYTLQVGNPDLLADSNEVAARCLLKAGLVKADFTADDYKALAEKGFEGAPFDTAAPAFRQCLANTGGALGGTS